jgi:hypothetical protein
MGMVVLSRNGYRMTALMECTERAIHTGSGYVLVMSEWLTGAQVA